jgi:hypothetical protein
MLLCFVQRPRSAKRPQPYNAAFCNLMLLLLLLCMMSLQVRHVQGRGSAGDAAVPC